MPLPLATYRNAIRDERWKDAATDPELHQLWKDKEDPLARALLITAAAHLHASTGNQEGARAKLERAEGYLQGLDGELADQLRRHVEVGLDSLEQGSPPAPLLPVLEAGVRDGV